MAKMTLMKRPFHVGWIKGATAYELQIHRFMLYYVHLQGGAYYRRGWRFIFRRFKYRLFDSP